MNRPSVTRALLGCAVALTLAGCSSTARHVSLPEPRPLATEYAAVPPHDAEPSCGMPPVDEPTGTLLLEEALEQALMKNPALAASSHRVQAAAAHRLQAALLPNPELVLELEEVDRAGMGWDSSESTIAIAQELQLGGKRRRRTDMAQAESELAGWDYETRRLNVYTGTTRRFVAVVAAQRGLDLARSMVGVAEETHRAVTERVNAGKEPRLQASKAEAELEVARIGQTDAENQLEVARRRLAATWGGESAKFEHAEGALDDVLDAIPPQHLLEPLLDRNPDLARWEAELRLRQAALSAAKAERVPSVTAAVGYHQYEEDGTDAFSFGVGLPLPLFDRNQGEIAAEKHRLAQAEAERRAILTALSTELAAAHTGLVSAHGRVLALREKVVPAMEEAFEAASGGYRQGKFGFIDMLDAQRGLFETHAALLEALEDYHAAAIDIQRATGTGLQELSQLREGAPS